ncbi:MAG: hypothetical protein HOB22_11070 [Candidatus Marinimicrobia bacterium]|jgi:hypothetical protein|nr:hypothetical protein [Candidatus Neomarinimicrobiota bacterium]MBT6712248.1 hypothetical protein [Candidatus Neomarinimicrobiota bacterium]
MGRAVNPVTKTNWKCTGIELDINVPQQEALDKVRGVSKESWIQLYNMMP